MKTKSKRKAPVTSPASTTPVGQPVPTAPASTEATPPALDALPYKSRDAFNAVADQIDAVDENKLVTVNLDITSLALMITSKMGRIQSLRSKVAALPEIDIAQFDNLETFTYAALYARTEYLKEAKKVEDLPALSGEITELRDQIISDLQNLAKHKLVDIAPLSNLHAQKGFKGLIVDTMLVSSVMRDAWNKIQGRSAMSLDDLARAEGLTNRLMDAVGLRDENEGVTTAANLRRQKAYTLFVNAYDQARRAINFVRWNEGDADSYAPSLFSIRATPKASDDTGTTAPATNVAAPTNGASNSSNGSPVNVAPSTPGAGPVAANVIAPRARVADTDAHVPVGHPNSEPFTG